MFWPPNDLKPLPDYEWDERGDHIELTPNEIRTALWESGGNISQAANLLKTTSGRLRRYVRLGTQLHEELREIAEQLLDKAESNVVEALHSNDPKRRDAMTRFVLTREFARNREFAPRNQPERAGTNRTYH